MAKKLPSTSKTKKTLSISSDAFANKPESEPNQPRLNSREINPLLVQVRGWSVHSEERGILGPLYADQSGKLYYLDTVDYLGFFRVSLSDKVYRDEH